MVSIRGVTDKGLEDLRNVMNRLTKSYGMNRINGSDFAKAHKMLLELIDFFENMEENLEEDD